MFTHFIVSASVATLVSLVTLWAHAAPSDHESWADASADRAACELEAERAYYVADTSGAMVPDAAWEDTYAACVAEREEAVLDVDSFVYASRNVAAAPAFCAATIIERTPAGYRAVCLLAE